MTKSHVAQLNVAIVGAGPAALYTAAELAKCSSPLMSISLIDRLPTIGGLARYGVAPDHAERRKVIDVYEVQARSSGKLSFFGNVEIGKHVSVDDLLRFHHAVIFASGAAGSRELDIPGSHLKGCFGSSEFVGWYNGHPDHAKLNVPLEGERAVIVGNGNVALDIARLLLANETVLKASDMASHALYALSRSAIRDVYIIGRRGAGQAKFTHPELLELGGLDDVSLDIRNAEIENAGWELTNYSASVKHRALQKYANRNDSDRPKKLSLQFLASPTEILGATHVEGIKLVQNRLVKTENNEWKAVPGSATEMLEAGLIIHAIGYKGQPIIDVPFDVKKAVIPNKGGRILLTSGGAVMPRSYVVGWIKRGPQGVLGSNKSCAKETVAALLQDYSTGHLSKTVEPISAFKTFLYERQADAVGFNGWKKIDRHERGSDNSRQPSKKLTRISDMIEVANSYP